MTKRIFSWILFLISTCAISYSDDEHYHLIKYSKSPQLPENNHAPLANLEGEPSALVHNCVNVISGQFCLYQTDLIVHHATDPLTVDRSFAGSKIKDAPLAAGWHVNHSSHLIFHTPRNKHNGTLIGTLVEDHGGTITFMASNLNKKEIVHSVPLRSSCLNKGVTNNSQGYLSGQTNLKNQKIAFLPHDHCAVVTGSGLNKEYQLMPKISNTVYWLFQEKRPTGNIFRYGYTRHDRLQAVQIYNSKHEPKGGLLFDRPDSVKTGEVHKIKAGLDRYVSYEFVKRKNGVRSLRKVERTDGPFEEYYYLMIEANNIYMEFISKKVMPLDRKLAIKYYDSGHNDLKGFDLNLKDPQDPRIYRVKQLQAPAGTDAKLVPIYDFVYDLNTDLSPTDAFIREYSNGSCIVYDALNNKSQYIFDTNQRLTAILKFDPFGQIYTREDMTWADNNDPNSTCLMARSFTERGITVFDRRYSYDKDHNVIEERLYGNLSGNNQPVPNIFSNEPNLECYKKNNVYSQDGFNLLLEECDGVTKTSFTYHPGTNRLIAKYQGDGSQIMRRWFYTYNDDASVTSEIVDDGSSSDQNDLSNVTERLITRYTPRETYPCGYPTEIAQYALDMVTGQEMLIHKVVNTYTPQAKITKQEHYDSQGVHRYTLTWEYDHMGNVTKETDALGYTITKTYDVLGNCTFQQGPRTDCHNEFIYDFMNRPIVEREVHADGITLTTSHRYNLLGQRTATIDPYGNETNLHYDGFGRIIQIDLPPIMTESQAFLRPTIRREYNALSKMTKEIDSKGTETQFAYNIRGQLTATYYPDGTSETNTYNMNGSISESKAKNGTITRYQHDALGRPTLIQIYSDNELLSSTTKTYSGFHLTEETDPMGIITKYAYYPNGKLKSKQKENAYSQYFYDTLGRLSKTKEYYGDNDADATITALEYDPLDRVTEERIENISGTIISKVNYTFDISGNTETITKWNESGQSITRSLYNSRGIPVLVTDADGNQTVTQQHYNCINILGQTVSRTDVTDPLGNVIITIHDTLGRPVYVERKNSLGTTTQLQLKEYDLTGNLCTIIDRIISPEGENQDVRSELRYDTSNRLIACYEAVGTSEQKQVLIAYNEFGEKATITKNDSTKIYHTYDKLGRLAKLSSSDDTIAYVYTYDLNNNPLNVSDDIQNTSSTRAYDKNNRLTNEVLANGLSISYENDPIGRPQKVTLPDNSSIAYRYHATHLTDVLRFSSTGENVYTHTYERYDLSNNLLSSKLAGNAGSLSHTYDILGRAKSIQSPLWSESITKYDRVGNILEKKIDDTAGTCASVYTYDDLYQLTAEKGCVDHTYACDSMYNRKAKDGRKHQLNALHQLLDDGIYRYTYDPNGNITQKQSDNKNVMYTYDALDRLTSFCDGFDKVEYSYDENNRRLAKAFYKKESDSWNLINTVRFLYQGQNEIGAVDDKGNIFELRLLGIGKGAEIGATVAMELQGKVFVPMHDHIGNIACLLDAEDGHVVESYRYSAFGEPLFESAITPWTFASKRYDAETGFIYFGRRYYDPEIGRWVTPDPIGREGGPNLYAYVLNSPLTHFDLYGLFGMNNKLGGFFETCFETLGNIFSFVAAIPGKAINLIGTHLVPIPYVKDAIEFGGWCLEGKNPRDFIPSWNREHSKLMKLEGKNGYGDAKTMHVHFNGILVNAEECRKRLAELSSEYGHISVWSVFNDSQGLLLDLFEVGCQRLGIPTRVQQVADKCVRAIISQMGEYKDCGTLVVHAHSQGAVTVDNLSPDLRKMIDVTAMAPARVLQTGDFKMARNYIIGRDIVPFTDPWGLIRGRAHGNVHYLPTTGSPLGDHYYDSAPFRRLRTRMGQQFQDSLRGNL